MDAADTGARIGPNAILQLVPVLDRMQGRAARDRLMAAAGVAVPPDDAGMWPETQCRAAHLAVWQACGDRASAILSEAGQGTADYILAHRVPSVAKSLIRALPGPLGARLLARAIAQHAWTFTGSGRFRVARSRPLTFEITANPLAFPGKPCPWHAAVFQRLYETLVWPDARVEAEETPSVSRFTLFPR
ncbi:MAG: bacteriochlorophyll 4-vinyl reductase [Tabrizicola sp.]|jgi:divinyl protochlorophyllide a 8-vinyl-reductase|nr:bacteriochlorophyll 4-vinyl reductase [Tabrizicola sp.]